MPCDHCIEASRRRHPANRGRANGPVVEQATPIDGDSPNEYGEDATSGGANAETAGVIPDE